MERANILLHSIFTLNLGGEEDEFILYMKGLGSEMMLSSSNFSGTFSPCCSGNLNGHEFVSFVSAATAGINSLLGNSSIGFLSMSSDRYVFFGSTPYYIRPGNQFTANVLGMPMINHSGTTVTSSVRPFYIWRSTQDLVVRREYPTDFSFEYEGANIATERIAENGETFTTARTSAPINEDYTFAFELNANILNQLSSSAAPWTMQRFYSYHKWRPYIYFHTGANIVNFDYRFSGYKLQGENTVFEPKVSSPGLFRYMDIVMKARKLF